MKLNVTMLTQSVLVVVFVFSFACCVDAQSVAAQSVAANGKSNIAICDVEYLLSHYAPLQKTLRETEEERARIQGKLKAKRQEFQKLEEKLFQFKTSSDEYQRLEEMLEEQKSNCRTELKLFMRQFDRVRADARSSAVESIQQLVKAFSLRHGIDLVIHQSTQSKSAEEKGAPFSGVVFHNNLDITTNVMEVMKKNELATNPYENGPLRIRIPAKGPNGSDERIFSFFMGYAR